MVRYIWCIFLEVKRNCCVLTYFACLYRSLRVQFPRKLIALTIKYHSFLLLTPHHHHHAERRMKLISYQTARQIIISNLLATIKHISPIQLDAAALKVLMNFCFRVSALPCWTTNFHCITCILTSNALESAWMKRPKWVIAIKISRPKQKQNPHQGRAKVEKENQLLKV